MPHERRAVWRKLAETLNFSWLTQQLISVRGSDAQRRPDLLLFCDGRPVLIIESKISAGFTTGALKARNGRDKAGPRLRFYDEWLADQTNPMERSSS